MQVRLSAFFYETMDMKAIIGIIVAVAVIGGGAWYVTQQSEEGTEEQKATGTMNTGTYATLLALGGSQECQVSVMNPDAPATGTVYVSGDEVRSDVVATPEGTSITAHMIKTGGYLYMWTDMMPQGVRVKESAAAEMADENQTATGFNTSTEVSYSCKPWIVDASKFEVPGSVTFMEFGAQGGTGGFPMPNMPLTAPQPN